jgi:hypothetical protein
MMGKEAFLNSPMIVYLVKMTIRSGTPRCGACLMPKAKTKPNLHRLPYPLCKFVLSTSPQRELVNDFQKPPVPEVFYMPLWTEAEMENVASTRVRKQSNWRDRFKILGGIPRLVLEDTRDPPTTILEVASSKCSLDDFIRIIGIV